MVWADKSNFYWNAYKTLEKEVIELSLSIAFDDINLDNNIHSLKIADLIMRTAAFIEALSKDLYIDNGGQGNRNKLKYDYDCINTMVNKWGLQKREIILKAINPGLTKQKYIFYHPFDTDETKKWNNRMVPVYTWNTAYQALKHDLVKSIPQYATVYNLLNIMSAFYLLNLYYDTSEYYIGSKMVPEKLSLQHELFAPNMTGITQASCYVAIYFGSEWEEYVRNATSVFVAGGKIETDFSCTNQLNFSRRKLVLNKGQTEKDVCPGLPSDIIEYISKNTKFCQPNKS